MQNNDYQSLLAYVKDSTATELEKNTIICMLMHLFGETE